MTAPRDRQELVALMARARLEAARVSYPETVLRWRDLDPYMVSEQLAQMESALDALEAHCTVCPNEPTEEMVKAGWKPSDFNPLQSNYPEVVYRTMLARAPYRREK